jgi:hypothetical protein
VYDWGSRRTTFLSFGGKVLGTVALPATLPILNGARGGGRPKPVETGPVSFELSAIYNDGSMLGTATFGSVTRDPGGAVRGSRTEIGRMSSDGRTFRSFAAKLENPNFVSAMNPKGLVQSFWVPFASASRTHHAVAADGNRFALLSMGPDATGAASFSLTVIGAEGDTIVDRRYRYDAQRITPAMADEAVSRMVGELARPLPDGPVTMDSKFANEVKRRMRSAVPAFRSPFHGLAIGTDNSIWVLQEVTKDTTPLLIFRPDGSLFGRLALTKGFRLIAERSMKQVWMIGSDKDGFAIVSRFRIEPK